MHNEDIAIAAQTALDLKEEAWWEAFSHSRDNARAVVLESSPLAEAILALIEARGGTWVETPQQLMKALDEYAEDAVKRSKFWPKASNSLSRQLKRLAPDLQAIGLDVQISRSKSSRLISCTHNQRLESGSKPSYRHLDGIQNPDSITDG